MACFHFRVELFENSYNERCMKMWIYVIAKKESYESEKVALSAAE